MLKIDNGCHRGKQCLLALFDGIDKPPGSIDFLLNKHHSIFHFAGLIGFIVGVIFKHLVVGAVNPQFGHIGVVELNGEYSVIIFDDKIGNNG